MSQAHHHALHTVLAASGQHTEEVNAKGTSQLSGAAYQVQLFQQSQVEASAPQPVLQAPPPTSCHNDNFDQVQGIHTSDRPELVFCRLAGDQTLHAHMHDKISFFTKVTLHGTQRSLVSEYEHDMID